MLHSDLSGPENHSRNDAASQAWSLSIVRHKAFRDIVAFVERHGLLEKFYILTFCLFYAVPNVWSARSCLYWFVLPLFLIVVPRDPLLRILRAPLLLVCMAFFLIVIVAAPFAQEVVPRQIGNQVRILLVLTAFLVVTAYLAYRDRDFPYRFFLYVSCTAAIGAALTVWNHLFLDVPASHIPRRLEGVPGMIVYYNPSFVGAIYGFACVGAAAAATRPGISRGEFSILAMAAAILGTAVVLTYSRHNLLGVVLALAIIIALAPSHLDPSLRRAVRIGALVAACVLLFGLYMAKSMWLGMTERGDSYRFFLWKSYWTFIEQHPWVGVGITAKHPVALPHGVEMPHPHNFIYAVAIKSGVLAAASVTIMLLLAGIQAIWAWVKIRALFPLVLLAMAVGPTQFDFGHLPQSLGMEWLVLWFPIGLCIGTVLQAQDAAPSVNTAAGATVRA